LVWLALIFICLTAAFKLAAYGVKQGGIGAVMAGGFPLLKKTGKKAESPNGQQSPVYIFMLLKGVST
jgi:hypothetical protein